jgi:putative DNA primase/helicase
MPDNEINTICRNEAYPDPATVNPLIGNVSAPDAEWFGPKGKFLHNILGETLIKDMNLLAYHRELYVYHDGIYVKDTQDEILREISDCFPESTKKQKEEVMEYLRIHRGMDKKPVDVYNINVQNGRLDLKTGNINPHTPEANDFQQINAKYDPEVVCPDVDKMLMRVFCGDKQLYDLFEEMMGYCLLKNCRMQKLFVFFGDGNNGKSTILRVISDFIGGGNYSTLSLQDLETTFRPAELENKLLNIGDDIPATTIRDSGTLKSTTTGEEITVERKNKPPFNLKNYAKMIFTTNKMPPAVDKSDGFYRRLCLIPLDAKFKVTDADFDPDIEEKVTSQEAMSHLLNMALRGYKRMKKNNKFTTSDKVENAVAAYKEKSSTTLTWLADICVTLDYLLSKSTSELNYEFRNWCAEEGIDPMKIPKAKTVTEEIEKQYGLHLSPQQREKGTGKQVRLFLKNDT